MSVTININNLSLCHKASGGMTTATLPAVCKTPSPGGPIPIPYPNIATEQDLAKGTTTVKADGGNMCANYGSEFFKSTGDEPGTAGGVVSNTFIKEATWITFSFDVKLEGKSACRLTDKMFHNHQNTVNAAGKIHSPLVTSPRDCVAGRSPVKSMKVKRKHINLSAEDKYGHWWIEMGDKSYGWWPSKGVGLKDTVFGVPGDLNGQGTFGGTATKDPHHGDDAEEEFTPTVSCDDTRTDKEIEECVADFANSYSGNWSWPIGQNCHSFQESMMEHCGLSSAQSGPLPTTASPSPTPKPSPGPAPTPISSTNTLPQPQPIPTPTPVPSPVRTPSAPVPGKKN